MRDLLRVRVSMLAVFVLGGVAVCQPAWAGTPTGPQVQTQYGILQGSTASGVNSFLGIRFAQPPVESLRWVAPQPPSSWSGVMQATAYGSQCAQPVTQFGMTGTNEDCLFLNVRTPANVTASSELPVMVWIHGGAFFAGEGSDYDGSSIITENNVIVVTLNYRLGLFGFLALPSLAAENSQGQTGNYGILDQQAAIAWVRGNIAKFGGNPSNITIFGESAGGQSVIDQLTSPGVGRLHGAIIESGAYAPALPTLAGAETTYEAIAASSSRGLNCTNPTAACMRALTAAQLVAAINPLTDLGVISPVVDGTVIPQQPVLAFNTGSFQHVPVINGNNHDEWRLFTALNDLFGTGPVTTADYPTALQTAYGSLASSVAAAYPLSNFASANYAYSATVTDSGFACGAHMVTAQLAQYVPVYGYELNDPNAPDLFLPNDPNLPNTGDSHASELPYLFPTLQSSLFGKGPAQFTSTQLALAKTTRASWASFARYGRPLSATGGAWVSYNASSKYIQSLISPSPHAYSGFVANHQCDLWKAGLFSAAGLPSNAPY